MDDPGFQPKQSSPGAQAFEPQPPLPFCERGCVLLILLRSQEIVPSRMHFRFKAKEQPGASLSHRNRPGGFELWFLFISHPADIHGARSCDENTGWSPSPCFLEAPSLVRNRSPWKNRGSSPHQSALTAGLVPKEYLPTGTFLRTRTRFSLSIFTLFFG